jgi:type II secretory pathway pseudopilin PulG
VILQQEYERLCTDMVNKLLTSQQKKMAQQQQQQQQHAMHAQAQMLVQQQQPTVQSGMWRKQVQATGTIFSDLEGLQATPLWLAMVCCHVSPFLPSCRCWWSHAAGGDVYSIVPI